MRGITGAGSLLLALFALVYVCFSEEGVPTFDIGCAPYSNLSPMYRF